REHAAQALDDALAPMLVGAQQHLGVGIALEAIAEAFELGTQLAEVVDLAVEGEREAGARIAHRLERAFGIDDREAPVAEDHPMPGGRRAEIDHAAAVGSAMRHRVEHVAHVLARDRELGADNGTRDPAHGYLRSARWTAPRSQSWP